MIFTDTSFLDGTLSSETVGIVFIGSVTGVNVSMAWYVSGATELALPTFYPLLTPSLVSGGVRLLFKGALRKLPLNPFDMPSTVKKLKILL